MIVRYLPPFKRAYRKLSDDQKRDVDGTLQVFVRAPFDPSLHNHKLHGDKRGIRSIAASYNLRILYRTEENASIAILIMVGTHDEVY